MAYRIRRGDRSPQSALRRIARQQIDRAIRSIDDPAMDAARTIHDVRKRCKKVRGLLRLVRPGFPGYRDENARFRAIARPLGQLRDAGVLIDAFDNAITSCDAPEAEILAPVRALLCKRRAAVTAATDSRRLLAATRAQLLDARSRTYQWRLHAAGFDAFAGIETQYRRARRDMRRARAHPSADGAFHAWRKRCKDHACHLRLFVPLWPGPMQAMARCATALGELLGQHHDLAVLAGLLRGMAAEHDPERVDLALHLIHARQQAIAAAAFAQGRLLFADKPSALAARWRRRYLVWRSGA